jgi:hypothetical protein
MPKKKAAAKAGPAVLSGPPDESEGTVRSVHAALRSARKRMLKRAEARARETRTDTGTRDFAA